jgi:membrane fusion protein (multidrug efflux system)
VLQSEKGYIVFALDPSSKVTVRPIQVGEWAGSDWVVLGGLNPGDRIVADNLFRMQPGVTVEPVKAEGPPPSGAGKGETPANGAGKSAKAPPGKP